MNKQVLKNMEEVRYAMTVGKDNLHIWKKIIKRDEARMVLEWEAKNNPFTLYASLITIELLLEEAGYEQSPQWWDVHEEAGALKNRLTDYGKDAFAPREMNKIIKAAEFIGEVI